MSPAAGPAHFVVGRGPAAACPFLDHAACTPGYNEGVSGLVERHAHSTVQPGASAHTKSFRDHTQPSRVFRLHRSVRNSGTYKMLFLRRANFLNN
jgi:hypothetical protein